MAQSLSFAFLPYLKTSEPIRYKDIVFRNIEDLTDLSAEAIEHLNVLRRMFFLRDNLLIKQITYTTIQRQNEDEWGDKTFLEQLREFQTIVTYLYSAPHKIFGDPFLRKEHASLYICMPKPVPLSLIYETQLTEPIKPIEYPEPDHRGEVNGYEVILDFRTYIWVTKGSRIYPPAGYLNLNYSQDLQIDLDYPLHASRQTQLMSFIASKPERSYLSNRILTALEWYNRSIGADIEDAVALVHLAIAFECLLNLEQGEKVTARFKEAITLLLGGLPRLDSWLTQFYDARSEIVHKGRSNNLLFIAMDEPKKNTSDRTPKYRSLVSVGRQIFQLCLSTVTYGASIADDLNLPSMLFTNQQRLEEICRILDNAKGSTAEKLQAVTQHIHDIDNYKFIGETGLRLETLIGAGQLTVKSFLETSPQYAPQLLNLLADFTSAKNEVDYYTTLSRLQSIQEYKRVGQVVDPVSPLTDVLLLLDCVWYYTFTHYYWLKESKEKNDPSTSKGSAS